MAHNKDNYGDGRNGTGPFNANTMRSIFSGSGMTDEMHRAMQDLVRIFATEIANLHAQIQQLRGTGSSGSTGSGSGRSDGADGVIQLSDGNGGFRQADPPAVGVITLSLRDVSDHELDLTFSHGYLSDVIDAGPIPP